MTKVTAIRFRYPAGPEGILVYNGGRAVRPSVGVRRVREVAEQQAEKAATTEILKLLKAGDYAKGIGLAEETFRRWRQRYAGAYVRRGTTQPADPTIKLDREKLAEYRKKLIMTTYNQVTAEQLENKTPEQLDAFEEALKALTISRGGPGPYAIPGSGGGAAPLLPIDRAKALLEATPIRGARNEKQN